MRPALPTFYLVLILSLLAHIRAVAELQFDIFVGFEGHVHESGWFPVTCEVFNDGPSFNAVIEISEGQFGRNQKRLIPIELPTNTRKRIVVPVFSSGGRYSSQWEARLLNEDGKKVAERANLQTRFVAWETVLLGALPRNFGGTPVFPETRQNQPELQPQVGRMLANQFPDNPIALEGLNAIYLNSEKAIELQANQVAALLGWVRNGGHLILAVEQSGDIASTLWLKQIVPMEFVSTTKTQIDMAVMEWIKSGSKLKESDFTPVTQGSGRRRANTPQGSAYATLPLHPSFKDAQMPVSSGPLKDGRVLFAAGDTPLAVEAPRGRGKITVLTFSPEREPFRSWKDRGYFWAKLCGIPGELFNQAEVFYGGWSIDGIFGALIESRQIRKLPVSWLLLLLFVYLMVIGPFDQWWLKKINRQMLTWITFPSYVVLFSLLIYFIGYKLRAGDTEWNEMHIVDVLPRGDKVDLRGRTYISIYSSSNARYPLVGETGFATIRTEMLDVYSGTRDDNQAKVVQYGNSFKSDVFVPVWTSSLFANDWFQTNEIPFLASVANSGSDYILEIENLLDQKLSDLRLAVDDMVYELEPLGPREKKSLRLATSRATPLSTFVQQNASHFQRAVELRRNPLGDTSGSRLENRSLTGTVASFLSLLDPAFHGGRGFIAPNGVDLVKLVQRGDAVLFAWVSDFSFVGNIHQFNPPRFKRDTLMRLSMPVKRPSKI